MWKIEQLKTQKKKKKKKKNWLAKIKIQNFEFETPHKKSFNITLGDS